MARIFRSSAEMKGLLKVLTWGRSFIKMQKSRELCVTPLVTLILSMCDLQFVYIVFADLGSRIGCLGSTNLRRSDVT